MHPVIARGGFSGIFSDSSFAAYSLALLTVTQGVYSRTNNKFDSNSYPIKKPNKACLVFRFLGKKDVEPTTNQTYDSLLKNLTLMKIFASGIIVPKSYIWPVDAKQYLLPSTCVVFDAHKEGLEVYASEFANDVPFSYSYSYDPVAEYLQFVDNGNFSVDGVISDFPITPSAAINCFAHLGRNATKQAMVKNTSSLQGVLISIEMRISWRDGLVSRTFDMDEFDRCRYLSDEEEDCNVNRSDPCKSSQSLEINVDEGNVPTVANASGYDTTPTPQVMIQSSNSSVLMKFKGKSNYKLVYKVDEDIGGAQLASIDDIKRFASAVVISKDTQSFQKIRHCLLVLQMLYQDYKSPISQSMFKHSAMSSHLKHGISSLIQLLRSIHSMRELISMVSLQTSQRHLIDTGYLPLAEAPNPYLTEEDVAEAPLPPVASKNTSTSPNTALSPSPNGQPKVAASLMVPLTAVVLALYLSILPSIA
ncbi:Glycerophosphoryl diester phosphodiesterase [Corchorus capsularis]|uniref:glycerophosphodiester phosphodiesterase n=1 Tax=Corchorus capsularis TaxID=210143 RepID=A0A1R3IVM0_COCAP|nr:Glycerophosphoryl diester phosphodiesterase [Corchorus capsularis]